MKRILYIEDSLYIREKATSLLELRGYSVIAAQNGREGLALARENMPDLIVCDLMMSGLDAYEVLIALEKDLSVARIPFVFVASRGEAREMTRGLRIGAIDYIRKPFNERELFETIERCLAG